MDFLIDTHVIIWAVSDARRLSTTARQALTAVENRFYVSLATAWEYADLRARRRLPEIASFESARSLLALHILSLPDDLWRLADGLPNLHGDPVDRMLVAHTLQSGKTLLTADVTMRSYPIPTVW